jgi:hypothetical protein
MIQNERSTSLAGVWHVTSLTHKSFIFLESVRPSSCNKNEIQHTTLNILFLLKPERNFGCAASYFEAFVLCSSAGTFFPFIVPDKKFDVFSNCDRKLKFSWMRLPLFWVLKYVLNYWNRGSIAPVKFIQCRTKNFSVFSTTQKRLPASSNV